MDRHSPSEAGWLRRRLTLRSVLWTWLLVALLAVGCYRLLTLDRWLNYKHAGCTGEMAIIASNYARFGILSFGGLPQDNWPPLDGVAASYAHWPPLAPMLSSFWVSGFGADERSMHALSLLIYVLRGAAFLALAVELLPAAGAAAAGLVFLLLPVQLKFGEIPMFVGFALIFVCLMLRAWKRRQTALAPLWSFLAVLLCWEAAVPAAALAVVCWRGDSRDRRTAWLCAAGAVLGGCAVFALYAIADPGRTWDTFQALLFRMNLAPLPTNSKWLGLPLPPLAAETFQALFTRVLAYQWSAIGPLPLACTALAAAGLTGRLGERFRPPAPPVFVALLAMWFGWSLLFPRHVANHEFELIIAAPAAALCTGWCLQLLWQHTASRIWRGLGWAAALAGPLFLLSPWITQVRGDFRVHRSGLHLAWQPGPRMFRQTGEIHTGILIRENTPPGSVVLDKEFDGRTLFYAQRRILTPITSLQQLETAAPFVRAAFPNRPIYLAIRIADHLAFAGIEERFPLVRADDETRLYLIR